MLTKTAFFAILNDANNRIGDTAHIAEFAEGDLIIRQHGAPNCALSMHRYPSTTAAAFAKYNAWLNEWFTTRAAAEARSRIDALEEETFAPAQPAPFGTLVRQTATTYCVQLRFAALMVHTGNYEVLRRGAEFREFISDRKGEYVAAHPDRVARSGTIISQDDFTAFILSGVWL